MNYIFSTISFLYVFGGSADNTLPNDLFCYDLDAQIWTVIKPEQDQNSGVIPSGRVFHAAAVIKDAMYIFGGTVDNNVRSGDMFRFQFPTYPRCTLHDDFGKLLTERQFCDVQFIVGYDEVKVQAHIAMVAARSPVLKEKILAARKNMNEHLEKLFGTIDVPFADRPTLEVKIVDALPEAFEKVLNYIYTDRIDCKSRFAYFNTTKQQLNFILFYPLVSEITDNKEIVRLMMDIFQLAVQYLIPRLENVSIQYLELKIQKSNVLDAFYYADKMK